MFTLAHIRLSRNQSQSLVAIALESSQCISALGCLLITIVALLDALVDVCNSNE